MNHTRAGVQGSTRSKLEWAAVEKSNSYSMSVLVLVYGKLTASFEND